MRQLMKILAAGAILAPAAFADIKLNIPKQTITDSAAVKKLTGLSTYLSGGTGTVGLSLTGDGAVKLSYTSLTNGSVAYKVATGLLIPLDPAFSIYDLSAADSIYFDIKTSVSNTKGNTVRLNFEVGSDSYDDVANSESASLGTNTGSDGWASTLATLEPTNSWTTVGIDLNADLIMAQWSTKCLKNTTCAGTAWTNGTINIGEKVKNFQIQPNWHWNSDGSSMTNGTADFEVRNIVIKKASLYKNVVGVNCTGTSVDFSRFTLTSPKQNAAGGYFFVFSDTSSTKVNDTATGTSDIPSKTNTKGKRYDSWDVDSTVGAAVLTATLEKDVPTSTFLYHAYAGWADLGTNFGTDSDGNNLAIDFSKTGFNAISFTPYFGASAGGTWDSVNVPYLKFLVAKTSVGDAQAFSIKIPVAQDGQEVCVDLDSLAQPSWYTDASAFTNEDITQLTWRQIINDQVDTTLHTSGPNTFAISGVKFWGIDSAGLKTVGIKNTKSSSIGFNANYRNNGLVLSYQVSGDAAHIDVVRLNGSKVASLKASASASNLNLPLQLQHGTYLVSVRGTSGKSFVKAVNVAR